MEHEVWGDLPDGVLRSSRSGRVCITCQGFGYATDAHCHTLLVCHLHRAHIPQGQHLVSRCPQWLPKLETRIGWSPEAA
jgi:hypothetical protein